MGFACRNGRQTKPGRLPKNDLPQGSFLAPTLFTMYNNDWPIFADIRSSIYADYLCLAIQGKSLSCALATLSCFNQKWFLNPNHETIKVFSLHPNNRNAARTVKIQWEGK